MARPYNFLQVSTIVFKVLAWVALVMQIIVGLVLIIQGGEPVLIAGRPISVRLVGLLNFVTAGLYFFSFWLMSSIVRLLLDIRGQLSGLPAATPRNFPEAAQAGGQRS